WGRPIAEAAGERRGVTTWPDSEFAFASRSECAAGPLADAVAPDAADVNDRPCHLLTVWSEELAGLLAHRGEGVQQLQAAVEGELNLSELRVRSIGLGLCWKLGESDVTLLQCSLRLTEQGRDEIFIFGGAVRLTFDLRQHIRHAIGLKRQ